MEDLKQIHQALGISSDYAKLRGLSIFPEETNLVESYNNLDDRKMYLEANTAQAWAAMQSSAGKTGIELLAFSGFRDYQYQKELIQKKLAQGQTIDQVLTILAAPGFSEHHTGRAIDLNTPGCPLLSEEFETTDAFKWLEENALQYSFTLSYPRDNPYGFIYEPWHWCYR